MINPDLQNAIDAHARATSCAGCVHLWPSEKYPETELFDECRHPGARFLNDPPGRVARQLCRKLGGWCGPSARYFDAALRAMT
jgi:hypothetical protein